ncbi:DGPFAETKE family protein [Mycolicibacterium mageritense DSM 44476 = CIP 104973]
MHYQEGPEAGLTDEDMEPARAAFARYADDLDAAGVLIGTQVLQSAAASTTYTARNGAPEIQDGPFADTRERLGGVFVIDVADLDAALSWARRCPAAQWGAVEIRPVAVTYRSGQGWYAP